MECTKKKISLVYKYDTLEEFVEHSQFMESNGWKLKIKSIKNKKSSIKVTYSKPNSIVYTTETSSDYNNTYTLDDIDRIVEKWLLYSRSSTLFLSLIADGKGASLVTTLTDYLCNLLTWQHPETLLDELDEEEIKIIISSLPD